jgi:8-oxo-dGTP diphosphatase
MCSVDAVVLKKESGRLWILLIERGHEPFQGMWALPGGFIGMEETLLESVQRELWEETGLTGVKLEQFDTFGDPGRDPRGRVITVVFRGFVHGPVEVRAGDDARLARWFDTATLPSLAFDHEKIIKSALTGLTI